jgi:hypothetical protein
MIWILFVLKKTTLLLHLFRAHFWRFTPKTGLSALLSLASSFREPVFSEKNRTLLTAILYVYPVDPSAILSMD